MKVQRIDDAAEMLAKVQRVLEEQEVTNGLPLGILLQYAQDPDYGRDHDPLFLAYVEHSGRVPLVMVMTPPRSLILAGGGRDLDGAISAAVSFLQEEGVPVPGVMGPREVAQRFASMWCERAECAQSVLMEQMIYQLDRVAEINPQPGKLIVATDEHIELMAGWLVGFAEVTLDPIDLEEAREQATRIIGQRRAVLWVDEEPVSMAWRTRPTRRAIAVSGVYTPPEHRRKGYATTCVAALSQRLLDEGYTYCALYTDLANPTSNSIYRKIGYRPVQASIVIGFA